MCKTSLMSMNAERVPSREKEERNWQLMAVAAAVVLPVAAADRP
jgi:hypothetical protein